MERYDYFEAVKADVAQWINDNLNRTFADACDMEEYLNDTLWAEENLTHNFELIEETAENFGCEPVVKSGYEYGAEWWDVSIRCYLLGSAITAVIREMPEEELAQYLDSDSE